MKRQTLSKDELKREREMLHELKKFHRENQHLAAPVATHFTKKRIRVPQLQPETNPFCVERQLADDFEDQFLVDKHCAVKCNAWLATEQSIDVSQDWHERYAAPGAPHK